MPVSLANFFKSAPPPRVVLLPDTLFFVRALPVAAEAAPEGLVGQVELALEAFAPFPLSQLYYGFYHPPGAPRALVYAAYRKRFTPEQTAAWAEADLVIPTFVALLGAEAPPATTLLAPAAESLTVLRLNGTAPPEKIFTRALASPVSDDDRARAREELLKAAGESQKIIELHAAPAPMPAEEDELAFQAGDFVSRLPAALADQLDVRDKDELAARRRQRMRDLVFWRVLLGCVAALAFCFVAEFALVAGKFWQKSRQAVVAAQNPAVQKIVTAENLANKISELSTKRLLPFEMISLVSSRKPASVQFLRANANEFYKLDVEAQTNSPGDVGGYQTALASLPACAHVEVRDQRTRDGVSTFTLAVTFKPEELKPAASP